jgi:predicted transcriptional regulator
MSAIKDKAIDLIQSLPDDCTLEDIQYHLYVSEKVERGIRDIEQGRTVSQEEAEQRVRQWLK